MEKDNKSSKIRDQLPEPVIYDRIYFMDGEDEVNYTDCFEISLYRFLHLLFTKQEKINFEHLTLHMNMESEQCLRLKAFFEKYPKVYREKELYTTDEAFTERADWCVFLNQSKIFKLKKFGKYEVCATFENLLSFFMTFFPKIEIPAGEDKSL